MNRSLRAFPWYVSVSVVAALAAALAVIVNVLVGPYFERSFLDETDPLASAGAMPEGPAASHPTIAAPVAGPAGEPGVLLQGEWRDGEPGHNGEGIATIIRTEGGKFVLRVEMFSVTNGPDLIVVLSPDANEYADGSLNLGELKATDGNFNYDIPDGTDLSQYKSVVVWCRSFPTTFAFATLEDA